MKKRIWLPLAGLSLALALFCGCGGRTDPGPIVTPSSTPLPLISTATPSPTPTATPTPTPTPTPSPTPSPTPTPAGLLGARYYPNAFRYDGQVTEEEDLYVSENVHITVRKFTDSTTFQKRITYFVADIKIQDIRSFRTAWAGATPVNEVTQSLKAYDDMVHPILSMNGDYISAKKIGIVIRNGTLYRSAETKFYDICALMKNGEMKIFPGDSFTVDEVLSYDPWQCWCFGPSLLDEDGNSKTEFQSNLTDTNPRSALGYYEPGHYCFVVVDGRKKGYSSGVTMRQLSKLMHHLGCKAAYNMDGGSSSQMRFLGELVNLPSGARKLPDIIYITEPPEEPLPEDWTDRYYAVAGTPKPTKRPTPRPTAVG